MNKTVKQSLENLPDEILALPRFFKVRADKRPLTKGWSNPDNQKLFSEIEGYKGFDTAGHDKGDDYLFLDFDHVLTENGKFVTTAAEQLFNRIHDKLNSYCELSASKQGIHIIAKPTKGKFKKISSGKNGRIYFNEDNTAFLELFYGTGGRYCYFTGNVYQCEPQALVAHGETVDALFQELLDLIADQNKKSQKTATCAVTQKKTPQTKTKEKFSPLMTSDDRDRALNMLAVIPVADISREDWVNVGMALKNNGNSVSDWEQWSNLDSSIGKDGKPRYKQGECETLWQGFSYGGGLTIATIHDLAKKYGYKEPSQHDALMNDDDNNYVRTRERIRDCPVDLILPENFIWTEKGITQRVPSKKKDRDFDYFPVTKTPIIITKKIREPSKGTVEFEIALRLRDKWNYTVMDGKTLADARQLTELGNYDAIINATDRLKQFFDALRACNPDLQEIKTYKQTGWTDDDFTNFAYPKKDGNIVRRAGFDFDRTLATRGNAELWKKKFIEVADKGGAIAHAYMGIALAAVIARPLNIMNPQAHLFGVSGSGKTALQKFTASIFGNPRELMRNFSATNKNRQLFAAAFCDLPSFYDELETIQGKNAEEQLSNDIYNFADGKGNQANKRDGTARETFRFGGARLTTGERPILKQNDLRGAYKRLLQFTLHNPLFDDDFASDLHIFSESFFGHYVLQWIQFAQEHMQEIQNKYLKFAKGNPTTKQYEPTHLKMLAAGLVAFEFFKVCIGIITEFDDCELIRNRRTIIDEQLPTIAEIDDTERSINALKDFVASRDKFFQHEVNNPDFGNEFIQTAQVCYGKKFKNGEVAFFKICLAKILEEELNFASADKLISEWYNKGFLRHANGKKTYPTYINGKYVRMIRFEADILADSNKNIDTAWEA